MPRTKHTLELESQRHWVAIDGDDEPRCQLLAREVRDGWTGRVRRSDDEIVEDATWDGERRVWRDDDDEPIWDVVAIDLTRPEPKRLRSLQLKVWVTPELRERLQALADTEGETVAEWIERQVERCEVESEMRGTVGTRRGER